MLNLKKTAVAVLAFGSSAVFAGTMGPVCSAVNVTIPCENTAWMLGGKALYLNSNFGHKLSTLTSSTGLSNATTSDIGTKYGWGFMIEGAYHFNTGNDLNINWYHINNGHSRTFGGSTFTGNQALQSGLIFDRTTYINSLTTNSGAYVSANPQWDAVNIELGQEVDFGDMKRVRFHGGFEWARLAGSGTVNAAGSITTTTAGTTGSATAFNFIKQGNPTYNGFGPRLGSDFTYDWGNGLGMYANGAMTLLAGTNKSSFSKFDYAANAGVTSSQSTVQVVPELEGKLGLTYGYATAQGDIVLDVAWMWVNYFGALSTGDNFLSTSADTNFGLQGVIFGLKWMGNVA